MGLLQSVGPKSVDEAFRIFNSDGCKLAFHRYMTLLWLQVYMQIVLKTGD